MRVSHNPDLACSALLGLLFVSACSTAFAGLVAPTPMPLSLRQAPHPIRLKPSMGLVLPASSHISNESPNTEPQRIDREPSAAINQIKSNLNP